MFEKNLNDLVRGLRNNKQNEAKYIAECLDNIKQELRQENMALKANAVLKLSYVQMLGYDISWAAFNIIEVMSSPKFTHKRVAYMAASQSFHSDLDVLMLATNLIKKDMNSQNQYDAGAAMVGLSCFVSPDLARDLANDIMSMMVSSKPYIRKRAILLMYKVFLNFPEALRPAFPRLKERLEDPDQGVQCAAVNVICELARKNPKNYLALAPLFFKLMTTSSNNWMLIKIIKLFGALCPLEPRLGKKLLEPLTSLIHSTSAMSLLYECINTVISGLPDHQPSMQLCVSKLRLLIEDQDQNLKYLGLLLLNKILKAQPKIVVGHKDLILQCLDDRDESIRYRALDLVVGMISKKTLVEIIKKLMVHMEKAEGSAYRDELLAKIIQICSLSNYQFITNFEWYIDVLLQLSAVEGTKHGRLIANQMLDVAIRVKAVRSHAVPVFSSLLGRASLLSGVTEKNTSSEVLFAAAWVAGEYAEHLTDIHATVACLSTSKATSLPGHIQCVFIQAIGKLFSRVLAKAEAEGGDEEEIVTMSEALITSLPIFTQSSDLEVQDRSCCVLQLIKLVMKMKKEGVQCSADVSALFAEELLPVAPKAQKKVPIPEGLDLDKWINEPLSDEESEDEDFKNTYFADSKSGGPLGGTTQKKESSHEPTEDELEKAREIRRMFQESNPHYLKGSLANKEDGTTNGQVSVDDIPVKELDLSVSLKLHGKSKKGKKKGKKGKKGGRKESSSEDEVVGPSYEVTPVVDLGGEETVDNDTSNDPHNALDIDLDAPLGDNEVLPVQRHRIVSEKTQDSTKPTKKRSKKDKEGKKHRTKSVEDTSATEKSSKKDKSSKKTKKRTSSTNKGKVVVDKELDAERSATLLKLASQASDKTTEASQASDKTTEGKEEDDDINFWLSPESPPPTLTDTAKEKQADTSETTSDTVTMATSDAAPTEKKVKKKSKKDKTVPKEKKKKKSKKIKADGESVDKVIVEDSPPPVDMMMDLNENQTDPWAHYQELCGDKNIKLLYEVRCDPMQNKQVICSIIFKNVTSHQIQKLEFNVLDSLNMKLVRQLGASKHDPVLVPFQLLPDMTNEGQFAFTVDSLVMSQFLRGTLTYILKQSDGSTSEKLDFKLSFPVSNYFYPHPISSDEFTGLLAGGELKDKQSVKITFTEEINLDAIIQKVYQQMHFTVVEKIEDGASLYGETIQTHPLCLLIKKLNSTSLSIDGKSTDFQLLSSVMKEIKDDLES